MTSVEIEIAKSLCYDAWVFEGTREAQFLKDMGGRADFEPGYELSDKQRGWLYSCLHKYRKQLPDLHRMHCQDKLCRLRMEAEEKKRKTQLVLF